MNGEDQGWVRLGSNPEVVLGRCTLFTSSWDVEDVVRFPWLEFSGRVGAGNIRVGCLKAAGLDEITHFETRCRWGREEAPGLTSGSAGTERLGTKQ